MSDIKISKDMPDDNDYIKWIDKNPSGFVLNIHRRKNPSNVHKSHPRIHFADCHHLNDRPGENTAGRYFKVRSNSIEELEQWSWVEYQKGLNPCKTCKDKGLSLEQLTGIPNFQAASALSLKSDIDEPEERLTSETNPEKRVEIETLIKAHLAQGKFRQDVLGLYPSCPLTGLNIRPLLIASHIRPWSKCDDTERLNPSNGLMLVPSIDALFDSSLITFETDGTIKISPKVDPENQKRLGISPNVKLKIRPKSKKYFEYHRNHIFQKKE